MNFKEYKKQQLENEDFRKEYQKKNLRFETSQLITEARVYRNLSQKDLADLVGTRQPSIARVESGATLPSLSFLERIAEALGTYLIAPKFGFMTEASTERFELFRLEGIGLQQDYVKIREPWILQNFTMSNNSNLIKTHA